MVWLMDCSFQSTFGRSASAIKVGGHCLSPKETVKRHDMECTFEEILDAVFAQLNLEPEDINNGWFRSVFPTNLEFQPIYMSTQVKGQGTSKQQPYPGTLPGDALFPISSVENCDKLSVVDENSKKTEGFFDLDVNNFKLRECPCISNLVYVSTPELTGEKGQSSKSGSNGRFTNAFPAKEHGESDQSTPEAVSAPAVGEKQNCTLKVMCQEENSVLKTLSQLSNGLLINNFSQQTACSANASKRGNNGDTLNLRIKGKLSHFTFSETTPLPNKPPLNKETEVSQMESIRGAENDCHSPKRTKFRVQKDFLNFLSLAPEDWTFANIDTDFDL